MRKTILKTACISTFILTFAMQAQAKVVDEVEKSFKVESNSSLRLDNINGSVDIIAWKRMKLKSQQ